MRGAVGRAARGDVGEEPSDAPGGLKGAVGGTEPWRKAEIRQSSVRGLWPGRAASDPGQSSQLSLTRVECA